MEMNDTINDVYQMYFEKLKECGYVITTEKKGEFSFFCKSKGWIIDVRIAPIIGKDEKTIDNFFRIKHIVNRNSSCYREINSINKKEKEFFLIMKEKNIFFLDCSEDVDEILFLINFKHFQDLFDEIKKNLLNKK